jgi:hypothetical protein
VLGDGFVCSECPDKNIMYILLSLFFVVFVLYFAYKLSNNRRKTVAGRNEKIIPKAFGKIVVSTLQVRFCYSVRGTRFRS